MSTPVGITGGARRYCSMRISACVFRYVSVASAVGAPTGRRLRGGCNVGSVGAGIHGGQAVLILLRRRYGKRRREGGPWAYQ